MRGTWGLPALLFALAIALAYCPAAEEEDVFCDGIPRQVETDVRGLYAECVIEDDIDSRWAGYAVEGCIELTGAPEGDYAFALLHRGERARFGGLPDEERKDGLLARERGRCAAGRDGGRDVGLPKGRDVHSRRDGNTPSTRGRGRPTLAAEAKRRPSRMDGRSERNVLTDARQNDKIIISN